MNIWKIRNKHAFTKDWFSIKFMFVHTYYVPIFHVAFVFDVNLLIPILAFCFHCKYNISGFINVFAILFNLELQYRCPTQYDSIRYH